MRAVPQLAISAAVLSIGCAAQGFDGRTYHGEGYTFRIPTPPRTWHALEVEKGTSLAFRDSGTGATVAISGRCGDSAEDVPLASLTQHLFIQFTERDVLTQEVVPFDGREAMHSVVVAKLDGVPKKFDVWVLKKDGCIFDMLYFVKPDQFEGGAAVFRAFVKGFQSEATRD